MNKLSNLFPWGNLGFSSTHSSFIGSNRGGLFGIIMKNGQGYESVEIELDISPSFNPSLKIRAKKGSIYYKGDTQGSFTDTRENTIKISESDFNDMIEDIQKLPVFSIPEFAIGFDGTTYTIRIENGWNSVTYSWWGKCPKEWEQLGKLVEKLIDFTIKDTVMSPNNA